MQITDSQNTSVDLIIIYFDTMLKREWPRFQFLYSSPFTCCSQVCANTITMMNIFILSLLFGITQKLADAVNEHGTKLFNGAKLVFGILFGLTGSRLIIVNEIFFNFYISLVIYWLIANKLDFFNHQLSGAIMLIAAFLHKGDAKFELRDILFVLSIFFLFKWLKTLALRTNTIFRMLIIYKSHHIIIAGFMGFWFSSFEIFLSIALTIIGIQTVTAILTNLDNYSEPI